MSYNIGDKFICKEKLIIGSPFLIGDIGDIFIVVHIVRGGGGYHLKFNNSYNTFFINKDDTDIHFESIQDRRKRIIKEI